MKTLILIWLMLHGPDPVELNLRPLARGRVPATRRAEAVEILSGPRGGRYWITAGGRKHYLKRG